MKFIIGLVVMLLPILSGAQSPPVRALSVGDTVPDIIFNHVINYKDTTARLSDFKGKLVILDFWATTCMSCIYGFPNADSLQDKFKNSIQILLVNPKISRDSLPRINNMLAFLKTKKGHEVRLPIALYDESAYAHFPFVFLPNCVWIGSDGIVKAITGKEELTTENLSALLRGEDPGMKVKNDVIKGK